MKRKFLAKAITLGLMLAVPFGVDAAETLVADKTVDGEKKKHIAKLLVLLVISINITIQLMVDLR